MTYTSIDRILSKFQRDYGGDVETNDLIEWSGEALEAIGTSRTYEEATAFIEVKGHQCPLPNGIHNIIQIARNNRFCPAQGDTDPTGICPDDFATAVANPATPPPNIPCPKCGPCQTSGPVWLDCDGTPLCGWEGAYYRPYFDLRYEYDQYREFVHGYGNFSPVN